ncbi:MAG TPA: hypothetical protein PKC21_08335 [Oligoflexia bacterium]|nr:hypothetical protein [Oligoflexia bacterium]HMR25347.1 hypothetical protein [Oligoflexia bacterium]
MKWFTVGVLTLSCTLLAQTHYVKREDLIVQKGLSKACGHLITWSKGALIYKGEKGSVNTVAAHRNFDHAPGSNYERSIMGHSALLLKYENGNQDYISFFPKYGGGSIITEEGKFTSYEHNMNYYVEQEVAVTSFTLKESAYNLCVVDFKNKSEKFNGFSHNCTHSVLEFLQEELNISLEEELFSTPKDLKERLEFFLKQNPDYYCEQAQWANQ